MYFKKPSKRLFDQPNTAFTAIVPFTFFFLNPIKIYRECSEEKEVRNCVKNLHDESLKMYFGAYLHKFDGIAFLHHSRQFLK